MSKAWWYSEAPGHRVGTMICTACRMAIESGDFRYRETDRAYLPQHRACSEDDPRWVKLDIGRRLAADREAQRRAAFSKFVEQWGLPDDLIEEYQQ